MTPPSPGRALRLLPGTLLVFLGVAGIAPSPARAGCDHHVLSASDRLGLEPLFEQEFASLSGAAPAPSAPRRDLPCSGPSCSRNSGLPHLPAPRFSVRSESWCCTTGVPPWIGPELADELADPAPGHPRRGGTDIERPPRFLP